MFQGGTWYKLPSNCTRTVVLTYLQCAKWGIDTITECADWAWTFTKKCVQWAWQTVTKCDWWSFLFCLIWAVIVTVVCVVVEVIAVLTCLVIVVVEVLVVCLLWTPVSIGFCLTYRYGGTAFLLTDGSVMMQEWQIAISPASEPTRRWWKLTPDPFGNYAKGKWSRLADSHVARAAFASAVLADGRVVVCGGEFSDASGSLQEDDTNTCEIYDPVANMWTTFGPPTDGSGQVWQHIGDAPCALLPDGTLLVGSMKNRNVGKLDPATLTWTAMRQRSTVDSSAEDSWVLMPDNTVAAPSCTKPQTTWVYQVASNQWVRGNDLLNSVVEAFDPRFVAEIGPGLLLYDGTAFFLGGNKHTAVYSPAANPQWSNGPDLPDQEGLSIGILDGPGALLVNGNILFGAGFPGKDDAGAYSEPSFYFEFDGSIFYKTNDPPNSNCLTMDTRLLLLPNGDVMFCRQNDSSFYAYHSPATPQDSFRPVIQSCPTAMAPGSTIQVSGLQFNGLSQAVAYGDDSQTATNYPLVRVVNKQSNHVRYCRTFNHTTVDGNGNTVPSMGVATGPAVITTNVEIPGDIEQGDAQLFVVANGIPSQPFDITITTLF